MSAEQSPIRASDAERSEVVAHLQAAFAEGRLSLDELTDRVAAVLRCRDRESLHRYTADLPALPDDRRINQRIDALLADARALGLTWAELAALLRQRSRLL